jgi:hypothetical protein
MKINFLAVVLVGVCLAIGSTAQSRGPVPNPAIDMEGFLKVSARAAKHRESRRLTEDEFIIMSAEPETIVLDARSKEKYDELHIKGAINLSFPDITVESLKRMLPDRNARILIYCNNNFQNAEQPFPTKIAVASLNISTYISLYSYGYRNIYELGPLLDVNKTKLEFESPKAKVSPPQNPPVSGGSHP